MFVLQYTSMAYTTVPYHAWINGPRFETLEEARAALQKEPLTKTRRLG